MRPLVAAPLCRRAVQDIASVKEFNLQRVLELLNSFTGGVVAKGWGWGERAPHAAAATGPQQGAERKGPAEAVPARQVAGARLTIPLLLFLCLLQAPRGRRY